MDLRLTGRRKGWAPAFRRGQDFLALTRPRVVLMVLVTTLVGFYLASSGVPDYVRLLQTLFGTVLAAGGTITLNQYLEREVDARMERTRGRPLPARRLQPAEALVFGVVITVGGVLYLTFAVNALSGLLTAFIVGSYLFLYTPLKRKTSLCSLVSKGVRHPPQPSRWTWRRERVYPVGAEGDSRYGAELAPLQR